jgi:hypothetical protein
MHEAFARYIRVRKTRAPFCNAQSIRNALIERRDASTRHDVSKHRALAVRKTRRLPA